MPVDLSWENPRACDSSVSSRSVQSSPWPQRWWFLTSQTVERLRRCVTRVAETVQPGGQRHPTVGSDREERGGFHLDGQHTIGAVLRDLASCLAIRSVGRPRRPLLERHASAFERSGEVFGQRFVRRCGNVGWQIVIGGSFVAYGAGRDDRVAGSMLGLQAARGSEGSQPADFNAAMKSSGSFSDSDPS